MRTDKKQNFVRTSDPGVRNVLQSAGYPLVSSENGWWTFVNIGTIENLSFEKGGKFSFTNKLNI